jgi:hypothetical protein
MYHCVVALADRITTATQKLNFVHVHIHTYIWHRNSQRKSLNMHIPLKTTPKFTVHFYTTLTVVPKDD